MWASILLALQGANWQRGGGRGDKPKRLERPKEVSVRSPEELAARKAKLKDRQRRGQK